MSSVQAFREFINQRLTAAAAEIFTEFERTIVRYQEQMDRQSTWTEGPQQRERETDSCCPQLKEEQKDVAPPGVKEEQEEEQVGEKPFACTTCRTLFTNSSALRTHVRVHTGEKPFSCDTCGRRFTRQNSLFTHIKTHSGNMQP